MEYNEKSAVEYIKSEINAPIADDYILDIIDLIWDFYEDNGMLEISFDIPVEENENDIQVKLIEYVKHEIMSDNKEKLDLKIVEQIVLAELAYENTLDEF